MKRQIFLFSLATLCTTFSPSLFAEEEMDIMALSEMSPLTIEEELSQLQQELEDEAISIQEEVASIAEQMEEAKKEAVLAEAPVVEENISLTIPEEIPSLAADPSDIIPTLVQSEEAAIPVNVKSIYLHSEEKEQISQPLVVKPPVQEEKQTPMISLAKQVHEESLEKIPSSSSVEPAIESDVVAFQINFSQVFSGAPIIYSLLLFMSMGAVFIWLYNQLTLQGAASMPETLLKHLRNKLNSNQYEEALSLCLHSDNVFCKMLASGIAMRRSGLHTMLETMKSEGQRATVAFWQRLSLLNDIAVIAPMLGLLGTVIGMFYAFYDVNRSLESLSSFFDGLGVSVGTTVAGLIVAILSLILHSISKYKLVRHLAYVENEAQAFAALIDGKSSASDHMI